MMPSPIAIGRLILLGVVSLHPLGCASASAPCDDAGDARSDLGGEDSGTTMDPAVLEGTYFGVVESVVLNVVPADASGLFVGGREELITDVIPTDGGVILRASPSLPGHCIDKYFVPGLGGFVEPPGSFDCDGVPPDDVQVLSGFAYGDGTTLTRLGTVVVRVASALADGGVVEYHVTASSRFVGHRR